MAKVQFSATNRIYRQVFDATWVAARLAELRPYAQSLQAERAEAMAAALAQQQKTTRLQRTLLAVLGAGLLGAALLGSLIYGQYQRAEAARQDALT